MWNDQMADSKLNHHYISSELTTWSLVKLLFTYTLVGSASKVASKATYTLVAQLVKNLPAMWETWVRSLGLGTSPGEEDRRGYRIQNTLAFWPGEFHGLYSPWGHKESDMTEWLSLTHSYSYTNLIVLNKK